MSVGAVCTAVAAVRARPGQARQVGTITWNKERPGGGARLGWAGQLPQTGLVGRSLTGQTGGGGGVV